MNVNERFLFCDSRFAYRVSVMVSSGGGPPFVITGVTV